MQLNLTFIVVLATVGLQLMAGTVVASERKRIPLSVRMAKSFKEHPEANKEFFKAVGEAASSIASGKPSGATIKRVFETSKTLQNLNKSKK
ncbi:hypothetical protein IWQ60_006838 [Tieghemiomyces parasiticus]|uniref:RxLR effector protein n=1 Tax=Tieghemiomyces parasiticus TaxID=78921 RepID=A0A9W8DSJ9_9FUNG|nr:hypothetical protein IWQ60_006838 [Tieghemiomyces parasiticus]